jgi:hypothetical protein
VIDQFKITDIDKTQLESNCWFIASVAAIAQHKHIFDRVVPNYQPDFDAKDFKGIEIKLIFLYHYVYSILGCYHFRF